MTVYFAFLRALNVGGHTVKMDTLRECFEAVGLDNVGTFIASGNVIFESPQSDVAALCSTLEAKLLDRLGYPVATFIRTAAELRSIASRADVLHEGLKADASSCYVVFLETPPASVEVILSLGSILDEFHVNDREVYWLCRGKISESPVFIRGLLEKATGVPGTSRNIKTIKRLLDKFDGEPRQRQL